MSCSLRSRKTSKPSSAMAGTVSGPAAQNSSSPTLATPNHGFSSRASLTASTRSSQSRARARRSRYLLSSFTLSFMWCTPYQIADTGHTVSPAPAFELGQHAGGGAGVGERGRAHLHRVGAGDEQLGRVLPGCDAADADEGRVGERPTAVVDRPHRHRPD